MNCFISSFLMIYFVGTSVLAKDVPDQTCVEQELDSLKKAYQNQIQKLHQRIDQLEKSKTKVEKEDELENLLDMAKTMAREEKEEDTHSLRSFRGGQRQQQALNPNISLTGDFTASLSNSDNPVIVNQNDFTDGRNQFHLREAEFHIIAPLDPFTRGKFFLGIPGRGNESLDQMIGEAYMEWLNLPGGMNVKIGKYNTQFGILNRYHTHGLPQVDRPLALTHLFGTENFGGMGIAANFLVPGLWADVNELDFEIITGGGGFTFAESHDNIIFSSHLKNYWDMTRNAYFELGVSGAYGFNNIVTHDRTTLAGLDLTYKWTPAGRAHYRTLIFRNEIFYNRHEEFNRTFDSFGFYSYITNKIGARSWIGLRVDYSELPGDRENYASSISPYFDFWQSEFVMLRMQYSYTHRSDIESDHSIQIQTVWSMGPHKHEAY